MSNPLPSRIFCENTFCSLALIAVVVATSLALYGRLRIQLTRARVLVVSAAPEFIKGARDAAADLNVTLLAWAGSGPVPDPDFLDWAVVADPGFVRADFLASFTGAGVSLVLVSPTAACPLSADQTSGLCTVLQGAPSYSSGYLSVLATTVRLPAVTQI